VLQPETLEVRSGDKLLPGKTVKLVTAAGIKASEVISARGFVVPICGNVRCGWVTPQYTLDNTAKVAVVGATSRLGLCRALGRGQNAAKLFTSDMLELREKLFSNNKTAGSILQSTPYPRLAINQQSLIGHCRMPAKATNTHEIAPVKTTQSIDKTPVSTRELGQGQER
jgi:hypothetical protein